MDRPAVIRSEVPAAPSKPPAGSSEGRSGRWSPDGSTIAALAVVAVVIALPLPALFQQRGSPMEEGFMLVFPERVLAGDVPHRDFLHLYGPGSLWVLAGVYELAGPSLAVERAVGLVQQLGIVLGVFALARPFGRAVAAVCAATSAVLSMTAIGLAALAWNGGVALAVLGLVAGLQGRRRLMPVAPSGEGDAGRRFVLAGILGAGALLYRPDLVVAVALSYGAVAWGLPRAQVGRMAGAMAAVLVAGYGFLLVRAGPATGVHGLFLEPVFDLRGGRHLPVPPSWDHYDGSLAAVGQLVAPGWSLPSLTGPQQIVVWFYLLPLVAAAEVAYGAWRTRADPSSWPARCLLAAGLLGLGMLPQAVQRPDATHLAWVSCVPLALLPLFVVEAGTRAGRRSARRPVLPAVAAALVALVVLVAVIPFPTVRAWVDLTRQSSRGTEVSYKVARGDRIFYIGAEGIARAAQGVVDELDRRAQPGDRLFVGPADLRRTPYSDAFLYHLFPELPPATRYIEMDPGVANAEGSGLAEDVAGADWLILSHVWDPWDEPNDSRQLGSDAPNRVVARSFCVVEAFGGDEAAPDYLLYQRCR